MRRTLRLAFLGLALGCLGWGLHGRWGEVGAAVAAVPAGAILAAAALVAAGLLLTSVVWRRLLAGFGVRLSPGQANAVFFLGQLGKYIPGSVWSIGAQADLGRTHRVPARLTATTSIVFLGVNLATAAVAAGIARTLGAGAGQVPLLAGPVVAAAGFLALTPPVVIALGSRTAGAPLSLRATDLVGVALLMLIVWFLYGGALLLLTPAPSTPNLALMIGAFAAAYAVGVVVVIAPAGVGAREATLIALLSPVLGVAQATAAALLIRVLHTGADLVLALGAWLLRGPRPFVAEPARGFGAEPRRR